MTQLKIGDKAPDFKLPADSKLNISLSELNGKNVVIYLYPKDDTPGCTMEAKDFKDNIAEFEKHNTVILGMSKDSPVKHDKFKCKYDLPFNLVSDENGDIIKAYGSWVEKSMYGKKYMGIDRSTFLIDGSGNIKNIWRQVKVKGHVDEVLEAVKKIS